jgi:hypothetical protein
MGVTLLSLLNKTVNVLLELVVTLYADMELHELVAGNTNSPVSRFSSISLFQLILGFMTNTYLEYLLETCNLYVLQYWMLWSDCEYAKWN